MTAADLNIVYIWCDYNNDSIKFGYSRMAREKIKKVAGVEGESKKIVDVSQENIFIL